MNTYADVAAQHYRDRVEAVAQSLRETADRLERGGLDIRQADYTRSGPHVYAAHRAIHELLWGVANTNADGLLITAAEADAAVSKQDS